MGTASSSNSEHGYSSLSQFAGRYGGKTSITPFAEARTVSMAKESLLGKPPYWLSSACLFPSRLGSTFEFPNLQSTRSWRAALGCIEGQEFMTSVKWGRGLEPQNLTFQRKEGKKSDAPMRNDFLMD
jgi:hypothetical protein